MRTAAALVALASALTCMLMAEGRLPATPDSGRTFDDDGEDSGGPQKCCPDNYSGVRAFDDCSKYYQCWEGEVIEDSTTSCAYALRFNGELCDWFWSVQECDVDPCFDGTQQPTVSALPTGAPTEYLPAMCCPDNFTGLRARSDNCTKYYECEDGEVIDAMLSCEDVGNDLVFNDITQNCTSIDHVSIINATGFMNSTFQCSYVECLSEEPSFKPSSAPVFFQPSPAWTSPTRAPSPPNSPNRPNSPNGPSPTSPTPAPWAQPATTTTTAATGPTSTNNPYEVLDPIDMPRCCPEGFSGWRSLTPDCTLYFVCAFGNPAFDIPIYRCGDGYLFDESIQNCNWADLAVCTHTVCPT